MTSPTSRTCDRRGGFTLLELLLAIGVMSLVLALGLPRMGAVRGSFLVDEEARAVAGFVRAARRDAVSCRAPVVVTVAAGDAAVLEWRRAGAQPWTGDDEQPPRASGASGEAAADTPPVRTLRLDGAVRVLAPGGDAIVFFADGASSGGQLTLCAPGGGAVHRLRVDASTGAVMIQREASS
jgi:prepilin-type N-terminal cleavage/methylation domain-containing protein